MEYNRIESDLLIIGGGGAGVQAAIEASKVKNCEVLLINKGYFGKSGSTVLAGADIAVDSRSCKELFSLNGVKKDSPECFFEDMVVGGKYLNNQKLVEVHVTEAPLRVKELYSQGLKPKKLIKTPGHRYPRGFWTSGRKLFSTLKRELNKTNVRVIDNFMAVDLIKKDKRIIGALGLDLHKGEINIISAKAVIMATGGAARIYPRTTAPEDLTGDGFAMAYRAGAELIDMEFPMFLPFTFVAPQALKGITFPHDISVQLEVKALNKHGKRYMEKWDPERLEKTTRDINAVGAAYEIAQNRGSKNGGVYLSLKHLPNNLVDYASEWMPESIADWKYGDFALDDLLPDLTEDAMEVAPSAHFWNGGIKIDKYCQTNIEGLFAAGECSGGIHGANRLSGNAITDILVWGARAGEYAAEYAEKNGRPQIEIEEINRLIDKIKQPLRHENKVNPITLRNELRSTAESYAGLIRNEERLKLAKKKLKDLKEKSNNQSLQYKGKKYNKEWLEALQNINQITVLEMIIKSSYYRSESRASQYREDNTKIDNQNWLCNLHIKKNGDKMTVSQKPVVITELNPPRDIKDYN